jgi:hypothetical protein
MKQGTPKIQPSTCACVRSGGDKSGFRNAAGLPSRSARESQAAMLKASMNDAEVQRPRRLSTPIDGRLTGQWRRGGDLSPNDQSKIWFSVFNILISLVEPGGIEPPTSSMPLKRSPN